MAYLRRRSGNWHMEAFDGHGRKYYRTLPGILSRREARQAAEAWEGKIKRGLVRPGLTVEAWLAQWLPQHAPHLRRRTQESYALHVRRHIGPALGTVLLDELRPSHIQALYAQLGAQGLQATSVRKVHVVLHKALADAMRAELIDRNPASAVRLPPMRPLKPEAPDLQEIQHVISATRGLGVYDEVCTWVLTGLRRGELLGLRWSDVDLELGRATVRVTVQRINGVGLVMEPPKTESSVRTVNLHPAVVEILRARRVRLAERRLALGPNWHDHDLVFPSDVGTPHDPRNVLRAFYAAMDRAGLLRRTIRELRHWAASWLMAMGVDPVTVAAQIGHTNPNTTLRVYSHLVPRLQQEAVRRYGDMVLGADGGSREAAG